MAVARTIGLVAALALASVAPQVRAEQRAGPARRTGHVNTWSARSSTGQTFAGTWTAHSDPKAGTAGGTWTLVDAQMRTIASGTWSAARTPKQWTGAWRALVAGRRGEYSGTWSASAGFKADATFDELFQKAIEAVVGGTWRAGGRSGTWSIRAFE